ncbi:hypothetical protein SAMN05660420_03283 [Desulfuromusa kysingii]|uniref:Uncharacterized protein n=1 Tax=Desulfuromusa kysingii TaxID=37625 RepID=A0A1H4E9J6_9BACT|nr:hypothetical protein [Desulfuromusa kysingii]SEA81703.1 hypothetical protein SAMN05660420_03283 [Desulfuromusa kysingii]
MLQQRCLTALRQLCRILTCVWLPRVADIRQRLAGHYFCYAVIISVPFALSGCQSSLLDNVHMNEFREQLYIDAKLNFAIKHPQNWKRVIVPVSSPSYRADTVNWSADNPRKENDNGGHMLIRSLPRETASNLPDLLSNYLIDKPELKTGQAAPFDHPAGPALKFVGHDQNHGLLIIAVLGKQRNFIISLDYPSSRFAELLPIFKDIVASFTEIVRPEDSSEVAPE